MKILFVANKTLSNGKETWIDGTVWNFYEPLRDLGHDMQFYDTTAKEVQDFRKIVDTFKPELIFCCLTNDRTLTTYEPWEELEEYNAKGLVKTFNWFCDDAWRFDNFSREVCHLFTVCSTPEPLYIEKFKTEAKYENIILGMWHSNKDYYPRQEVKKKYDIVFCGQLNDDRARCLEYLVSNGLNVEYLHGLGHKEMLAALASAKIGISFSKNYNGHPPTRQMKGRIFEVPAAHTLLLTEDTPGIEEAYTVNKEIIMFDGPKEMFQKAKYLLDHPHILQRIATKGYDRFMKEHESHVRLERVLEEIGKK
tara:strand:- start:2612 stop:3535 length:924 start_codon:yes stop_codon:yes gene_type:complete